MYGLIVTRKTKSKRNPEITFADYNFGKFYTTREIAEAMAQDYLNRKDILYIDVVEVLSSHVNGRLLVK